MPPFNTINKKGQVTVPLEIRLQLGLREVDLVEFAIEQGCVLIRPARQMENPFLKYAGALPAFATDEEVNAWVRDLRDE